MINGYMHSIFKFSKVNNSKKNKAPGLLSISSNSARCPDIFEKKNSAKIQKFTKKFKN